MKKEELDAILNNATSSNVNNNKENEMNERKPILTEDEIAALLNVIDTMDADPAAPDTAPTMVLDAKKLAVMMRDHNKPRLMALCLEERNMYVNLVNHHDGYDIDCSDSSPELQKIVKECLIPYVNPYEGKLEAKMEKAANKALRVKVPFNWKRSIHNVVETGTKYFGIGVKSLTEVVVGAVVEGVKGVKDGGKLGFGIETKKGIFGMPKFVKIKK